MQAAPQRNSRRIHQLFVRQDYDTCLDLIEKTLEGPKTGQMYHAMFTKAMILRLRGKVQDSLATLENAIRLDPQNPRNLKEVAHSLHLLGKHSVALDVYDEAIKKSPRDWELFHNKGVCYVHLKHFIEAQRLFEEAVATEPHEVSYTQLGKVLVLQGDVPAALHTYSQALDVSPENADTLTQVGLLQLRQGDTEAATAALERANELHPQHPRAALALGSIQQDGFDIDGALAKYRIAAHLHPTSPQVWNNVGLCYFGKQRYIAAIACLKRALYLSPFDWIASYNLGLVHLSTQQHAAAFASLSAAINLKPAFPHSYMHLGVTLARLGDTENAVHAYERAVEKDPADLLFRLNYAITLFSSGQRDGAAVQLQAFQAAYGELSEDDRASDPELAEQAATLASLLATA